MMSISNEQLEQLRLIIVNDSEWQEGASQGKPRPGHPEGEIKKHAELVALNARTLFKDIPVDEHRFLKLTILALVHDAFKHKVNYNKPKTGTNHHGWIAAQYLKRTAHKLNLENDPEIQQLILICELHDEAHNAFMKGFRDKNWERAKVRAQELIKKLNGCLDLYYDFYQCDSKVPGKDSLECDGWFMMEIKLSCEDPSQHV